MRQTKLNHFFSQEFALCSSLGHLSLSLSFYRVSFNEEHDIAFNTVNGLDIFYFSFLVIARTESDVTVAKTKETKTKQAIPV